MIHIAECSQRSMRKISVALIFGFLMGIAAGLIGVGGGEFRMPVLLYAIGLPVLISIAVNLLVGLLTVVVSFLRRYQLGLLTSHAVNIAIPMSAGSIFGAYVGAFLTEKIPEKPLKRLLAVFLISVGLKIGLEPFVEVPLTLTPLYFPHDMFFAVAIGIVIGTVSGMLGVAGGEYRIPALLYLFGFDIRIAGTTSLLVSIPTVTMGFTKHHQMGHLDRDAAIIAIIMGVASVLGAYAGASYAGIIAEGMLKVLLGTILILATVRMFTKP